MPYKRDICTIFSILPLIMPILNENLNFKIWGILWWLVAQMLHLKVQFEVIVLSFV
jgi:hypothetical protein